MPICKIRQVPVHKLLPLAPHLAVNMNAAAICLKVFLLLSAAAVNCDDEDQVMDVFGTEPPPPPPPKTTPAPTPAPRLPPQQAPAYPGRRDNLGPLLSEIVEKSIKDSKAMIDEAVKTAAAKIADQVQEKMEQRLKRIEIQAEENVLKFNGIALFMVEKFHQKTEAVERKIVKSLDSISEVVQHRLSKIEHNTLKGRNHSKYYNSSIQAKETFDCEGYKKLALLKVRYGKYFVSENMTDWFGAKQFCEVQGMELVSFERASEMRAIWQLADASKEFMVSYWTSASDMGRKRGDYLWRDGTSIESELWINGQPEAGDSGDDEPGCVSLFIGRLRATSCNYQRYFICEGIKHDKSSALNHKIALMAE